MAQIDELDSNVADLEEVVQKLDEYTQRLGATPYRYRYRYVVFLPVTCMRLVCHRGEIQGHLTDLSPLFNDGGEGTAFP